MANRDAEATAYRAGLDAAANDARNVIADAEAKLKAAEKATSARVRDAEKDYQRKRLKDAKATLTKVEKAQKADDDDAAQQDADKAPAAKQQTEKAPQA
jgi:hypothetical protein